VVFNPQFFFSTMAISVQRSLLEVAKNRIS
jgi:hypothetical protein